MFDEDDIIILSIGLIAFLVLSIVLNVIVEYFF